MVTMQVRFVCSTFVSRMVSRYVPRRSRVAISDLESQPVVTSHSRRLRVATGGCESQLVISAHHGLVTSRNGTRNHCLGLCCLWSRVGFRLAMSGSESQPCV
ncbi:hypothetical protein HanIR_Chr07g0310511 [Helianthus annuus]|nr:hypothetical protein HanIR_Chr07g0310511 [Helianthus annuus]